MDLYRNMNNKCLGKYLVVDVRCFDTLPTTPEEVVEELRKHPEAIKFGSPGSKDEFFVLMLKDQCAEDALKAYAQCASSFDKQFADAVLDLADRAGQNNQWCKRPD